MGSAVAAVAAMALLLTVGSTSAKPADAAVGSISAVVSSVADNLYVHLSITAGDNNWNPPYSNDDVNVTATAGDFIEDDPLDFFNLPGCYYDESDQYECIILESNGDQDGYFQDEDSLSGPGDTNIWICNTGESSDYDIDCSDAFPKDEDADTTEIELWWQAPEGFDGGQVTFTAHQGSSVKTFTFQVLGSPATIDLVAQRDYTNEGTTCEGTPVYVIGSVEYDFGPWTTFNNDRAIICADVRDNAGHALPGTEVIWSVSGGGCLDEVVTNTEDNGLTHNRLESCSTGNSGDKATVTATSGSATDSVTVEFGGNPGSCTLVVSADPLDIGDTATVTATFKDDLGNKVPDGIIVHFVEVDSGDGADNVQFVSVQEDTVNSVAAASIIGAISGLTTVAVSIEEVAAVDTTCSEAIELSGDVHVHDDVCAADADFILYGNKPPAGGGFGTFAFCGGSYEKLLAVSGCPAATAVFYYNTPAGGYVVWIPGSTVAVVNADFQATFPNEHMPIPMGTIFTAKCK
jgi:hypothetical protein